MRSIIVAAVLCAAACSAASATTVGDQWDLLKPQAAGKVTTVQLARAPAPIAWSPAATLGGRPAGCPSRWCGCWLDRDMRMSARYPRLNLNRAIEWRHVGAPAAGPCVGCIAVWRHHVGRVTAVPGPGRIVLISGNDGRAVRERERSTRGVVAWRLP